MTFVNHSFFDEILRVYDIGKFLEDIIFCLINETLLFNTMHCVMLDSYFDKLNLF